MPIFCASSGILKMVMILFMLSPFLGSSSLAPLSGRFARRTRLHLVPLGSLGRWNHLGSSAFSRDLFRRGLGEMMRPNHELLRKLTVPQDAHASGWSLGEPGAAQGVLIDRGALGKRLVQVAHIDDVEVLVPRGMAEAALGDAAEERHLAAFEGLRRHLGAGTCLLPLPAARGRLAVTAADAAADALLALSLVYALMHGR